MSTLPRNRKYPSTELSPDQRELIARLAEVQQAQGISRERFRLCLENAGYGVSN